MTLVPRFPPRTLVPAAAALLLAGCSGGDGRDDAAVHRDTVGARWEEGLSASEVEAEARALSPEEAEAEGLVVDTSIHLEMEEPGDTFPIPLADTPSPEPPAGGGTAPARPR